MNDILDTIISVFNAGGITGVQENVFSPKRYILKYWGFKQYNVHN